MKKLFVSAVFSALMFLSACEIELRDGHRYPHAMGWEHRKHPDHKEYYDRAWHHDKNGNEVVGHPQMKGVEPPH